MDWQERILAGGRILRKQERQFVRNGGKKVLQKPVPSASELLVQRMAISAPEVPLQNQGLFPRGHASSELLFILRTPFTAGLEGCGLTTWSTKGGGLVGREGHGEATHDGEMIRRNAKIG